MMRYCGKRPARCVLLACALAGAGCQQPARMEGSDWPPPRPAEAVVPGPTEPVAPPPPPVQTGRTDVVSGVKAAPAGRLSDEQKQQVLESSLLNLQRMIISSDERLELAAGPTPSTAGRDALATRLQELGFQVIESDRRLSFEPSEADQDDFRHDNDCNLMFLLEAGATAADRFGNFWSFDSRARGKVLNLTTHQVIASKTVQRRGQRGLTELEAARSAQEAAAVELATYLSDEVSRKWEATSLVRLDLAVGGCRQVAEADDLRVGLQRRVGIYYVSLERWDDESDTAHYEVLCRFDVQRFLPAYIEELRAGGVQVQSLRRRGEVIRAAKGPLDRAWHRAGR